MDRYKCDQCPWQYTWTMGDRVKAVKRHQLAHPLDQPASAQTLEKREVKVPANQLIEYIERRLRNVEFV